MNRCNQPSSDVQNPPRGGLHHGFHLQRSGKERTPLHYLGDLSFRQNANLKACNIVKVDKASTDAERRFGREPPDLISVALMR